MPQTLKAHLETINKVSQDILTLLDSPQNTAEHTESIPSTESSLINENSHLTDEKITDLVAQRDLQIRLLLDTYTQEQLSPEIALVNNMVVLDDELISRSQQLKQELSTQVLKVKKSKKANSLYQNF